MLTPDEEYEQARDEPAFSNGTEGYGWMAANCDRCIHDRGARQDDGNGSGCALVLVALLGRTPVQWLDGPRNEQGLYGIADQYHCIEFRSEDDGPAPEPTPIPDPPGQLVLVPREDYTAVRMLTTEPEAATIGGAL